MTAAAVDTETLVKDVVARYADPRAGLIPILQDIQAAVGYISPQALRALERETGISANEAYGVATFYTQFRFTAPGRHRIQVCNGTACHPRAAARITEELCRYLGRWAARRRTGSSAWSGWPAWAAAPCPPC